jgi:hypothetical protein
MGCRVMMAYAPFCCTTLLPHGRSTAKNNTAVALEVDALELAPYCNPSGLRQQVRQGSIQMSYYLILHAWWHDVAWIRQQAWGGLNHEVGAGPCKSGPCDLPSSSDSIVIRPGELHRQTI